METEDKPLNLERPRGQTTCCMKRCNETLFFASPAELRKWFGLNHEKVAEQWIGFYKKNSGKPSITWSESIDQALCFGWIDGVRKSIDDESYKIRFTPRRKNSVWSEVNLKRIEKLKKAGLVAPAGLAVFNARSSKPASKKDPEAKLSSEYEISFKRNKKAWDFFQLQPPGYKRLVQGYVMSAKQESTRVRRLEVLISYCESGKRIDFMKPLVRK